MTVRLCDSYGTIWSQTVRSLQILLFSERELARPSVVCLSVTFVRPTQAVEIFGNISTALGTLAIR